jgi:hypothetical protein
MGFMDSVLSVATGGLSDLVQGEHLGSGSLDLIYDIAPKGTLAGQILPGMLLPDVSGYRDIGNIWKEGGSAIDVFSKTFNRLADPTNMVDYGLEHVGRVLPEDIRSKAPVIGATIGGLIHPGFAALGYGIGAGLQGQDDTQKLTGAGIAAAASYLKGGGAKAADIPTYTSTDYGANAGGMILDVASDVGGKIALPEATSNVPGLIDMNQGWTAADYALNASTPVAEKTLTDKVQDFAEKKAKDLIKNQAKKYINEALGGSQTIQPITLSQVQMQSYKPQLNSFQNAENIQTQQEQALTKEATKISDTQKTLEEKELERQGYLKKYLDYMYNKSGGRTQLLRDYLA